MRCWVAVLLLGCGASAPVMAPSGGPLPEGDDRLITMLSEHHGAPVTLVARASTPDARLGFVVYTYSSFAAWRARTQAEGRWAQIEAEIARRDEENECPSPEEAEREVRELRARSSDPDASADDQQVATGSLDELLGSVLPECDRQRWEGLFERHFEAEACEQDRVAIARFELDGSNELRSTQALERQACRPAPQNEQLSIADLDGDGELELLWVSAVASFYEGDRGARYFPLRAVELAILDLSLQPEWRWSHEIGASTDDAGPPLQDAMGIRLGLRDRTLSLAVRTAAPDCSCEMFEPRGAALFERALFCSERVTLAQQAQWARESDEPDPCASPQERTHRFDYDAERDEWIERPEPSAAR